MDFIIFFENFGKVFVKVVIKLVKWPFVKFYHLPIVVKSFVFVILIIFSILFAVFFWKTKRDIF